MVTETTPEERTTLGSALRLLGFLFLALLTSVACRTAPETATGDSRGKQETVAGRETGTLDREREGPRTAGDGPSNLPFLHCSHYYPLLYPWVAASVAFDLY